MQFFSEISDSGHRSRFSLPHLLCTVPYIVYFLLMSVSFVLCICALERHIIIYGCLKHVLEGLDH